MIRKTNVDVTPGKAVTDNSPLLHLLTALEQAKDK